MVPFAVMPAVVLALLIFAALVLVGVRLLRVLGLVCDPPDEIRYQPLPPAPVSAADYAVAARTAREQHARYAAHQQAYAVHRAYMLCQDVARRLTRQASVTGGSEDVAAAASATAAADAAKAAKTAADAGLLAVDGAAQLAAVAPHHTAALVAQAKAEAAAARLPVPNHRRLLVVLVVLLALWAGVMLLIPVLVPPRLP